MIYCGDCKNIIQDKILDNSIDLSYADPPFFKQKDFGEDEIKFSDTWKWSKISTREYEEIVNNAHSYTSQTIKLIKGLRDTFGDSSLMAYLVTMTVRINLIWYKLKNTGSFYLHCDPTASHYIKIILDSIFGYQNFRNEIVWSYNRFSRNAKYHFPRMHDIIFWYGKGSTNYFEPTKEENFELGKHQLKGYHTVVDSGVKKLLVYDKEKLKRSKLDLSKYDKIINTKIKAPIIGDVWNIQFINPISQERLGYPTQKPVALLERIIKACTKEGDTVLDPFCGCGTTLAAAQNLNRKWIGIDISDVAVKIARRRLNI